jgi:isochorismate synthase
MKFHRLAISPLNTDTLRAAGSNSGWLLEDGEALRVGLGSPVLTINLEPGVSVEALLAAHEIDGDLGPSDSAIVAFGSLPFNLVAPGVLRVPEVLVTQYRDGKTFVTTCEGSKGLISLLDDTILIDQEPQSLRSLQFEPTPEEYAHNVASAVEILRNNELEKVVLARSVKGSVPTAIDPGSLANRLRKREPTCTLYSMPISASRRYVGASPELLVQRIGDLVSCNPLAGTIALPANVSPENYESWLLGSAKNLHEHKLLVDEVDGILRVFYEEVRPDTTPSIMSLRTVAHLSSWIRATRPRGDSPSVMTLLRALHPTAAVCGIPRVVAQELLTRLENQDRGHYAGPVGWVDAEGNGQWWVGIRGVLLEGSNFEAWAGAGIVSESDPIAEREETKDKLASVLSSILIDRV